MKQLLSFNESAYNGRVETIKKILTILKEASSELKLHGVNASPKSLIDGRVHERAFEHYKKRYESSAFYEEEISFEKYMNLKDVNIEHLKSIDEVIRENLSIVFRFYKNHNAFYSHYEHRPESEIHAQAGNKIELPVTKLFKWVGEDKIQITLSKEYFELWANNQSQLDKIDDIENFIASCRKMEVGYQLVQKAISRWLKNLSIDLSSYELNYHEILKSYNLG